MTYEAFEERYKYDPVKDYLNEGGFGTVYKAYDTVRNRYVVIKETKVNPLHRHFSLMREVELAREIEGHENIAHYIACHRFKIGRTEMDYAILKYYELGNLADVLKNFALNTSEKVEIIEGILKGIRHLHKEGIIHRDLKSGNILIEQEGSRWIPKITDFGLSRMTENIDISQSNSSIGISYQYAAPEQIKGDRISTATDIWAIGVMIYQIMSNNLPFTSDKTERTAQQVELATKIVSGIFPTDINLIPKPFSEIIKQCLVVSKDNRIQSVDTILQMLNTNSPISRQSTPLFPTQKTVVDNPQTPNSTPAINRNRPASTPPNATQNTIIDNNDPFVDLMIRIPAGSFLMGTKAEGFLKQFLVSAYEIPQHEVSINNFHLCKYQVTQKQWQDIMGSNPSGFKNCDNCPVENVSWDDVQKFIQKLNALTGKNYRLPTEAEWEYAAQGGQNYNKYAGSDNLDEVAWYNDNSKGRTNPVGQKSSNGYSLYDMSGNVWEWCQDAWHDNYKNAPIDGSAWTSENHNNRRIIRGGSWSSLNDDCRFLNRFGVNITYRNVSVGFRLARD